MIAIAVTTIQKLLDVMSLLLLLLDCERTYDGKTCKEVNNSTAFLIWASGGCPIIGAHELPHFFCFLRTSLAVLTRALISV